MKNSKSAARDYKLLIYSERLSIETKGSQNEGLVYNPNSKSQTIPGTSKQD